MITVLPADDPDKKRLNWCMHEKPGSLVMFGKCYYDYERPEIYQSLNRKDKQLVNDWLMTFGLSNKLPKRRNRK